MKTKVFSVVGGVMVLVGAFVALKPHPDGPADIHCGNLTVSARWVNGSVVIPQRVLEYDLRELKKCELDGQPFAVPRADGGVR